MFDILHVICPIELSKEMYIKVLTVGKIYCKGFAIKLLGGK